MNSEDKAKILFKVFAIYFILLIGSIWVGLETKVDGTTLCVDGNNNINLEGFMCENKVTTYFGVNELYIFLFMIPLLIISILIGRELR